MIPDTSPCLLAGVHANIVYSGYTYNRPIPHPKIPPNVKANSASYVTKNDATYPVTTRNVPRIAVLIAPILRFRTAPNGSENRKQDMQTANTYVDSCSVRPGSP
jgi:hypothetical protein